MLNLSKYAIHYPIGRCGTEPIAGADSSSLQVLHDFLNEGLLYVLGVGYGVFVMSHAVVQFNGLISEN